MLARLLFPKDPQAVIEKFSTDLNSKVCSFLHFLNEKFFLNKRRNIQNGEKFLLFINSEKKLKAKLCRLCNDNSSAKT